MAEDLIYASHVDISTDDASRVAAAIRSEALRPTAQAFERNCLELLFLANLPYVLARAACIERTRGIVAMEAITNVLNARVPPEQVPGRVDAEEARLWDEYTNDPGKRGDNSTAWEKLRAFQATEAGEAGLRALLYATTVLAWSAFECVAKDVWVASVNARPDKLGRATIDAPEKRGKESTSPVSGKMIPFYVAEQYGFDLRSSIGSILSGKFDFTSIGGIRSAYSAAFGQNAPQFTPDHVEQLSELEALRHVIVHNGGVADNEFVRRTGGKYANGIRVVVRNETVTSLGGSAVRAGIHLLERADASLVAVTSDV